MKDERGCSCLCCGSIPMHHLHLAQSRLARQQWEALKYMRLFDETATWCGMLVLEPEIVGDTGSARPYIFILSRLLFENIIQLWSLALCGKQLL